MKTSHILGLCGLFGTETDDYPPDVPIGFFHDASAALVVNGETVAAVEEERLNREKHTNRFPINAVAQCLNLGGITPDQVDAIAYFFDEQFTDRELLLECLKDSETPVRKSRDLICERLCARFGNVFRAEQIHFVWHHMAHAEVTFRDSGLSDALVMVVDGNGEEHGVSLFRGGREAIEAVHAYPRCHSLGHFYTQITEFIGYRKFDEYKVMGLAPYGNVERYYALLSKLCTLGDGGTYTLDLAAMPRLLFDAGIKPRRAGENVEKTYADLAAAAQRLLEEIALHVLRYWQRQTGLRTLCVAGGVAQNTTLNGRVVREGLFDSVYVHPASHDGGAALGAAYAVDRKLNGPRTHLKPSKSPYLGGHIGTPKQLREAVDAWRELLIVHEPADICDIASRLLLDGEIIGWAQGRSEFGPRALGNRSILADPRPRTNRDRVNAIIKRREEYRPLAPTVIDHWAATAFEFAEGAADYSYMGFVVQVREEYRSVLEAVTHVDGTARVQILSGEQNPIFANLVERFGELTGVPVLLNTSFNNRSEPIVQDADDVITCLLTTGLNWVALGPYLLGKRDLSRSAMLPLVLSLSPHCVVKSHFNGHHECIAVCRRGRQSFACSVGKETATIVRRATARNGAPLGDFVSETTDEVVLDELRELWAHRLVTFRPRRIR